MPLSIEAINLWQEKVASMMEPTRTKFLGELAAGTDEWAEWEFLPEAAMRGALKEMAGLGAAAKENVVAWFLGRAAAPTTGSMANFAVDLVEQANRKGLTGVAREREVSEGLKERQRALPSEIGGSGFCQVLYVCGYDSSKLGKGSIDFNVTDGNAKGVVEDLDGKLSVQADKAYEKVSHISCLPAFQEWQAQNKRACYKFDKEPLVENISKYDLFVQQLAAISWGLAVRYHLVFMMDNDGKLEKTEDPSVFLRAMLVWQAEGQPEGPPAKGWTLATAKYAAGAGHGASSVNQLKAEVMGLRADVARLRDLGGREGGGRSGGGDGDLAVQRQIKNLNVRMDKLEKGGGGGGAERTERPERSASSSAIRCYECGGLGHIGRNCPERGTGADGGAAPTPSTPGVQG
jgi:hypothetical protein